MSKKKELENSILLLESMSQRIETFSSGMERTALMVAIRYLREEMAIMDDLENPQ